MKRTVITLVAAAVIAAFGLQSAVVAHHPITTDEIENQTILSSDISRNGVGKSEIRRDAVGASEIRPGAIDGDELEAAFLAGLQRNPVPSGVTIRGAVGGDFQAESAVADWGVVVSLPVRAANTLGDDDVSVVVATWTSGDSGQTAPTTTDTDAGCTGNLASPTAPAGKVCIYVAGGDNAEDLNGYSVRPGTGESDLGFKLSWTNPRTGDTFIDAVWAYRAP